MNKWHIELFLLLAILFIYSIRMVVTIEADPLEQFVRSTLLAARSFAEKVIHLIIIIIFLKIFN